MKLGVWKNPSSSLGDCSGNNQEDKACDCFFSPVICDRTSAVKSLLCTFPSGTPRNEILWQPPDLLALLQQPGVKSLKKGPLHHQRHTWSRLFPRWSWEQWHWTLRAVICAAQTANHRSCPSRESRNENTADPLGAWHSYRNRTRCETKSKNNWLYFSLGPNVLFLQDIHSKKHCLPGHKLM